VENMKKDIIEEKEKIKHRKELKVNKIKEKLLAQQNDKGQEVVKKAENHGHSHSHEEKVCGCSSGNCGCSNSTCGCSSKAKKT
jgi:hypothetical protein